MGWMAKMTGDCLDSRDYSCRDAETTLDCASDVMRAARERVGSSPSLSSLAA